jgi:hypothetical protein
VTSVLSVGEPCVETAISKEVARGEGHRREIGRLLDARYDEGSRVLHMLHGPGLRGVGFGHVGKAEDGRVADSAKEDQ